jgi:hypothetical protein
MKIATAGLSLLVLVSILAGFPASSPGQQVHVSTAWNHPLIPGSPLDTLLRGAASMRGVWFSPDIDGDGKAEIAVTNYTGNGRVHIFEVVGNDSIRLVWTSPRLATGGNSTPRVVVFGDLDNDGRGEVIYQVSGIGILIFEWDGVVGSDNYGTTPSQIIGTPPIAGVSSTSFVEYLEVTDIDGDGQNELLVAYNAAAAADDRYYVISADGNWDTNDPFFSSFTLEYEGSRTLLSAKYGLDGGTPYSMISANLDGTGNKEILLHNFHWKNVVPMRVPAKDTYVLADTANGKQNVFLSGAGVDYVSLLGGLACDIDDDGREEVYFPTWYGLNTAGPTGVIHMVYYNAGSNTAEIDSATNVVAFDLTPVIGAPEATSGFYNANTLGFGWGDIDGNGKKNLYFSGIFFPNSGFNVVTMEFQGGDKRNPANWTTSMLYKGDTTIVTSMSIRDSLGVKDTTYSPWAAQVARMYARKTDIDKDGKEDIILPFQGWTTVYIDSITITTRTWNTGGSKYDTTTAKVVNPKRWVLRILEQGGPNGVEMKDLTVIMPEDYVLEQNYPNPFNPSTTIRYFLPVRSRISMKVFDALGREVRTLLAGEERDRGTGSMVWDGKDNADRPVASGTYFCTMRFGNFEKTNKMMLLK